ncbi:hypothetical protein E4T38_06940 [Aureobasidium subglaciale]|nr:hypothetical protein E4T38_06940 [Aureobasidium subglaciale]KAI5218535.1 hypothetical protein E4T40_06871 [Aureobasidium subglaciale]KAI5222120.1 hypothetical protein E4T41_06791 [Aureobasidium subglaciale]KAI5259717.1 hypothetical protein E4T46_06769 [Aureobasidium subglaciale]
MVHLPNELWLEIASYHVVPEMACTHASRQTLIALCLVSKQLCAAIQPLLYHDFTKFARPSAAYRLATKDSEWLHKYYQRDIRTFRTVSKTTRLEKFFRTLINRPDLAAEIRYLSIEEFHDTNAIPYWFNGLYDKLPLNRTISTLFARALKNSAAIGLLSRTPQITWDKHLRDGIEGVEVALLLILVPQLRSLSLQSIETTIDSHVQELCDTVLGAAPLYSPLKQPSKIPVGNRSQLQRPLEIFPVLRSLKLQSRCNKDYRDSLQLRHCQNLLSLPNFTHFVGSCLQDSLDPLGQLSYHSLAHLRHVELKHCKAIGPCLEAFLSQCTGLRSLKIDSDHAFSPWGNIPSISTNFFTSLQTMTNTLERLILMLPEYENTNVLDLSAFGQLQYVEVDMSLMIRDDYSSCIDELLPPGIQEFADNPHLADLNSVRIALWDEDDDDLMSELSEIEIKAMDHMFNFDFEIEGVYSHWWAHHYETDSDLESKQDSEDFGPEPFQSDYDEEGDGN